MLLNCGVGEDSWESLGQQGDPPVHSKGDQSWVFTGRTDVEAETPILWPPDAKSWLIWKDPNAGKDWGQEEKGRERMRWLDGITDSVSRVWVDSESWWWIGRPGVLRFMGSQRVRHDWATELNWSDQNFVSLVHRNYNSVLTLNIFIKAKSQWLIKKSSDIPKLLINIMQFMHNFVFFFLNYNGIGSGFRVLKIYT